MIPKIIHLCWLGREDYPPRIKRCLRSWKEKLPDYRIMIWDTNRIDLSECRWAAQAYERKAYAFAADYVRFYALYYYGGIYLDSDVEVRKSFNRLLSQDYFLGYEYMGTPEAAVIGAQKGLKWIRNCLEWYRRHDFIRPDGTQNRIIAPLVLQKGFEKEYRVKMTDRDKKTVIHGGTLYPYDYFSPKNVYSGKICRSDNSYCIHHFSQSWLTESRKVRISRRIHLCVIRLAGRKTHNRLLYLLRRISGRRI